MKIIVTIIPADLVTFTSSLSCFKNQKQESTFEQVDGLVARNVSVFIANHAQLETMPNSINVYKGISLCYSYSYCSSMGEVMMFSGGLVDVFWLKQNQTSRDEESG